MARATAEEQPGVSLRLSPGLMQKLYEAAPNDRIVAVSVIPALVGSPNRRHAGRLRPEPLTAPPGGPTRHRCVE
jgi:hypothetical protein